MGENATFKLLFFWTQYQLSYGSKFLYPKTMKDKITFENIPKIFEEK